MSEYPLLKKLKNEPAEIEANEKEKLEQQKKVDAEIEEQIKMEQEEALVALIDHLRLRIEYHNSQHNEVKKRLEDTENKLARLRGRNIKASKNLSNGRNGVNVERSASPIRNGVNVEKQSMVHQHQDVVNPSGDSLNVTRTLSSSSHKNADSSANHTQSEPQLIIPAVTPKLSQFTKTRESKNNSKGGKASKVSSELETMENQPNGTKRKLVTEQTGHKDVIQLIGKSSSPAPILSQTVYLQPSQHKLCPTNDQLFVTSPTLAPKKPQRTDRDYCEGEVGDSAMTDGDKIAGVFSDGRSLKTVYKRHPTTSNGRRQTHETHLYDDPLAPPRFEDEQPLEPRHEIVEHGDTENDSSSGDIGACGDDDDGQGERVEGEEIPIEEEEEGVIFLPPLLTDFKKHVAADILRGIERGVLKCHNHTNKLLGWLFKPNPSNRTWRSHFRNSGLLRIKDVSYRHLNKNLISAFVERWHPETNSFHMPFGEMTITLDDVHCLTGLPIDGHPVMSSCLPKPKGKEELTRLFGLTPAESAEATRGSNGSSVKLEWLKTRYNQYVDSEDDDEVLYAARAYTLYVFGCSLFADKTGARVSTLWLKYLEDMERLHRYAWGAATLAYLYRQLGNASKGKCKQIAGYLTLLEAWIYERFPTLLQPQTNPEYTDQDPLAMKWSSTAVGPSQQRLVSLRECLDEMTATEVKWAPYVSVRQRFPHHDITYYDGCISVNAVVEPYMQDRVLRQYGYIQTVPEMPYVHRLQRNGQSKQDMKRAWTALARYFNRIDSHSLSADRLGRHAFPPWQCSDDYVQWFTTNSHVRVQNPKHRQTQVQPERVAMLPQNKIEQACALIDPCLQRWRSRDDTVTWDEAIAVMDAARTALHGVDEDVLGQSSRCGVRHREGR